MELTRKLRRDVLDLLDLVRKHQAANGIEPWADSRASKLCFNHGDFTGQLRKWDGGKASPTLEKVLDFERMLADQIPKETYLAFLAERGGRAN